MQNVNRCTMGAPGTKLELILFQLPLAKRSHKGGVVLLAQRCSQAVRLCRRTGGCDNTVAHLLFGLYGQGGRGTDVVAPQGVACGRGRGKAVTTCLPARRAAHTYS